MDMVVHEVNAVPPLDLQAAPLELLRDPELLEPLRRDAAAVTARGATGLLLPVDERSLASWLREHPRERVIVQGALTSLTGGAVPDNEIVLSTRKMAQMDIDRTGLLARVGPGLILADLKSGLAEHGLFYPPGPTHDGATLGGNLATNAAGAATFKYGTTRRWVDAIRIVLRNGEVLAVQRGEVLVRPGDTVVIHALVSGGSPAPIRFTVPRYESPSLPKASAGYFVRDPVDLVDLLVGSEGTLGIFTEATLRVLPEPPILVGFTLLPDAATACAVTAELRRRSMAGRKVPSGRGLDVRSIEFFDARCLALLRATGGLKGLGGHVLEKAGSALLFEQELPAGTSDAAVLASIESFAEPAPVDPVRDLLDLLSGFGLLSSCELVLPSDHARRAALFAIREAVPLAISDGLVARQREDPAVQKAGGDVVVPFEHIAAFLSACEALFRNRGIDVAVFGHISDGNVHPNAFPRDAAELALARQVQLDLGDLAGRAGGCPLSEHGVGRSPLKKELLRRFWADGCPDPLDEMRHLKAGLDPGFTLGRGVIFDPWPSDPIP